MLKVVGVVSRCHKVCFSGYSAGRRLPVGNFPLTARHTLTDWPCPEWS